MDGTRPIQERSRSPSGLAENDIDSVFDSPINAIVQRSFPTDVWMFSATAVVRTFKRPSPHLPSMPYSDDDLLEDIRTVAAKVGETPTLNDYRDHGTAAVTTIYSHFGSWQDALTAAGYEPREPDSEVTDEELLGELERLADELGSRPTAAEMDDHGAYWASTYRRTFGSWTAACEAAGLETSQPVAQETLSEEVLIEELNRVAEVCGPPPSVSNMRDEGKFSPRTYSRRFGSWNAAVKAAGLEPHPAPADSGGSDEQTEHH